MSVIPCNVDGDAKWCGIVAVGPTAHMTGSKLFCAPFNASSILVIDPKSETVHQIESDVEGTGKWFGIAAVGQKVYCAPSGADSVLVIDADSEVIHLLPCDVTGESKWSGITTVTSLMKPAVVSKASSPPTDENNVAGTKLYCTPCNASYVLVIDAQTDDLSLIACGVPGTYKWTGIAAMGSKLFCAPCNASEILMIDSETGLVRTLPTGVGGAGKGQWNGMIGMDSKLFCAPSNASVILTLEDRLSLWGL